MDFDNHFKRSNNHFNFMKYLIIFFVVLSFIGFMCFATKAKSSGKNLYTITVHNFNSEDSYISDSIVSQDVNKIVFYDMLGMKKTIVSPGISVTQF